MSQQPPSSAPAAVPEITRFFDEATNTWSYVVADCATGACAIIDSVMDFDQASGSTSLDGADAIAAYVRAQGLTVQWILETHVHADHLSAAPYLQQTLGGKLGIGSKITVVQQTFGKVFNEGTEFQRDGSQFDRLFEDGDQFHDWRPGGHGPGTRRAIPPPACYLPGRPTRLLWAIPCSCLIAALPGSTSPAAMPIPSINLSGGF